MKKVLLTVSSVLLFLLASVEARASSIVWEQLPSDVAFGIAEVSSTDPFGDTLVADNFTVSQDTTLTKIDWWGFNYSGDESETPAFTLTFYTDASGVPGSAIYTTSASIAGTPIEVPEVPGAYIYEYSLTLPTPYTAAADNYWLSIYNESSSLIWGWQLASNDGYGAMQDLGGGWGNEVNEVAFRIYGDPTAPPVPESSTLALLATGLVGLAAMRKRQARLQGA